MDMFEQQFEKDRLKEAPLAARMRPSSFDEFVGQESIVGKGRVLRRAIESNRLPSIVLWGPPGSGKTTLANIIASVTDSFFAPVSAVSAGVADLRKIIEQAKERRKLNRQRTILFHRRNPPLQQGAAGRYPAICRRRNGNLNRGRPLKIPLLRSIRRCCPAARCSRLSRLMPKSWG